MKLYNLGIGRFLMAMSSNNIIQSLLGILILILSGLFGWSLIGIGNLNKEVQVIRTERATEQGNIETQLALMQQTLDVIATDNDVDNRQNSSIKKFWVITNRHKDWINELRLRDGLSPVSWPDMSSF